MLYEHYQLKEHITISSLVTCYYFELSKTYQYSGERHDFWEIIYIDKGEVEAETDSGCYKLNQGDLLFHEPNDFHKIGSNGKIAPNVFIVSFVCHSSSMLFFTKNKRFHLNNEERFLLVQLMKEGLNAFGPNPIDSSPRTLSFLENSPFACEQMFKMYLEMLLIRFIRNGQPLNPNRPLSSTRENQAADLSDKIIAYLKNNLDQRLTLDHLSAVFNMGRTQLNLLFKKATGTGIISYANELKLGQAKIYIREEAYNMSEIAELLGFSSVHHFSRHFKKETGMAPTEYANTIKAHL
ncbi:AraC family transcriptional regulator [Paenibacillus contaminans]|jgi:AraC-like DNA-binding protein|nr:AraC family transcriptional regulator [Paenibacillus contaminans]